MKITLRKAANLQSIIEQELNKINLTPRINMSEFVTVADELAGRNKEFHARLDAKQRLLEVLFEMRKSLGAANATTGINDKLTELALIDKVNALYADLPHETNIQENLKVLKGKQDKLAKSAKNESYYPQEITSGVLTEKDVEAITEKIAELRKRKTKLNDEILELNIQNHITLSSHVVSILTDTNIL